jgi:MerR family transcriptional regulator/heat shock protein HspR
VTYYTRRQIVELLELDELFLVSLEREEIVESDAPPEAEGEFSERMLERARVAQNLVRDLEVNLPGVAVIVRLREEMVGLRLRLEELLTQAGHKPQRR